MRRFSKKQLVVAGVAAGVLATGGVALAYWTSTGSGAGSATTGSSSAFDVVVQNVNLADLSPGGPSDTVGFTVTNNNSGHQLLSSTSASVVDTSDPACTAANFQVSPTSLNSGGYGDLPSGGSVAGTFTVQMIDTGVNQDACQNVTVHLRVDASS
jgi:hypothetical protein